MNFCIFIERPINLESRKESGAQRTKDSKLVVSDHKVIVLRSVC
ncbi:hypothetical protein RISK_004645 [Rhodopirellula islandica]|uniref:Uncharacterized protein n=1 Tax=Rhodopirellula islandica TaxID=595434 RepID=A0A0J1B9W2_RHOIS|nr:hypothetical protein RISK_004645 [Rhodopirellula islandica]